MRFLLSLIVLSGLLATDSHAQLQVQRYGEYDVNAVAVNGSTMLVTRVDWSVPRYTLRLLEQENGTWLETAVLDEASDDFGGSLAIDGDWAAAGESNWNGRGRVRLYRRQGENWNRTVDLTLSVPGLRPDAANFGASIALEYPWLLVHAPNFKENDWGPSHGAVFFYEHVGGNWVYRMHVADDLAYNYRISIEGDVAVVGPFVYRLRDEAWVREADLETWSPRCYGSPVATDGERIAVGRGALDCGLSQSPGAVYIYAPTGGGSWALQDSIVGPIPYDGNWGDRFIDLKGSVLTVEERVYVEEGDGWHEITFLRGSDGTSPIGNSQILDSGEIVGLTNNLYVFDVTRASDAPSLIAPQQSALLTGTDSLVVRFQWEPVAGAEGYVLVAETNFRPRSIKELGDGITSDSVTYHLNLVTQDEEIPIRWQVSAVFEEGIGRPAVRSFVGLIETSYVEPPPFGGFDLSRFTPIQEGNRWEYRWTQLEKVGEEETTTSGYESFEILPDKTLGDSTYTVVDIRRYDDERRLIESKVCAFTTSEQIPLDSAEQNGACEPLYILSRADEKDRFLPDTTVEISGADYQIETVAQDVFTAPGHGSGGYLLVEWAADIGVFHYWSEGWNSVPQAPQTRHKYESRLLFATVNGEAFGESVVRTEPAEQPRHEKLVFESVYPNPVDDVLHLRLNTPGLGETVLEFFDVTGRRVHRLSVVRTSTSSDLTVDLPPGASGLLLLRATDAAGNTAQARVVRVNR